MTINKERLQDEVSDIICGGRGCDYCKLYHYKKEHSLTRCDDVPLQFQLDYAWELLRSHDNDFLCSLRELSDSEKYSEAIRLIKRNGVQYG